MRSDSEVNYAANPYGLPPERGVKRSLSKPLVLTVAGVTLLASAGLAAFTFLRSGGVGGPPPMIEADAAPTKSRAPDRGGAEDAAAPDRLVYERLSGATRPSVERLLPPPEQPMPRPIVATDPPPPPEPPKPAQTAAAPPVNMLATPTHAPPPAAAPPGKPGQPQAAAPQAKPGQPNQAAPHQPNPPGKPGQTTQQQASPPQQPGQQVGKPGQAPPPQQHAAAPPPQQHAAAPLPPGAPPSTLKPPGQTQPPVAVSSGGAGGWRIQLASVRSEAEASAEWKRLQARFPGVLGGLSLQVSKADLGDKGVFYRVHGGGVDEVRARSACDQLKSQNVGCVVVKP
jgi:hypothetical protein